MTGHSVAGGADAKVHGGDCWTNVTPAGRLLVAARRRCSGDARGGGGGGGTRQTWAAAVGHPLRPH